MDERLDGFCGFCEAPGHVAADCTALTPAAPVSAPLRGPGTPRCICSTFPALCSIHGDAPIHHDTYAEHCRERVPGTPAHGGGRCKFCDTLDAHGRAPVADVDPVKPAPIDPTALQGPPGHPWTLRQRLARAWYGNRRVQAWRRRTHTEGRLVRRMTWTVYWDFNDWWIGYYRGDRHHYVCPIPCLVIRWGRVLP